MNTQTGHVVADRNELPAEERAKYTLLPRWLKRAVGVLLDGKREAYVDMNSQSPLAHFARARNEAAIAKRARRAAKRLGNS
jgi:hypothetical protein